MSEIKVDALSTVSGSGNLTVDTDTLVVDTTNEKIGINQASPTYQLTVKHATQPTVEIESASTTGESRLYMTDPDSTGVGEIGYYHNGDTMRFNTGGVERMRLSSAGLHIGGTGAVNALDDYEYGTYSPSYYGSSGAGSQAYSVQHGSYVKIGNLCQVWIDITLSSNSGMSGNSNISLPFASASSAPLNSAGSQNMGNWWWWDVNNNYTGGSTPSGWIPQGGNYAHLYKTNGAASGHQILNQNTTGRISASVIYFTES